MRLSLNADLTYDFRHPAETLLLLEAARTPDQTVLSERLTIEGAPAPVRIDDPETGERRVVFTGHGRVRIVYTAEVEVSREASDIRGLSAAPVRELPSDALKYLRASRYCLSDRMERFVRREFRALEAGDKVDAILRWIADHVDYEAGVSDSTSTALDTFADRAGVCRDFTHLAISFLRAADIPARAVSAFAWRLDPPDMHAVVEVFLGGAWRLIDPTGKAPVEGLVRVATGLDAADIAFMTVFGEAQLVMQGFEVSRCDVAVESRTLEPATAG
ncbi:MAG: transglutaminase family protein [Phenylobacterium sp.]|nr:transglutaminase family protein [Phenylobacterium sp.]